MKNKLIVIIALFLIFGFALFLRVYFCYDKVFSDPIKYAADDGVYHMRLVENTLLGNHFPERIRFDPYTNFPHGTYLFFTPLYDKILSGIIWVVSLGKPTIDIINNVAPFYPAVLGSLVIFLVYFIAKTIWNHRKIALLSSILVGIYPPFLFKSLLGANDHHVAEVFFSSLAMLFFILILKIKKDKWTYNKKFWTLVILTGIFLGLYFLTWNGAILFLFIIFVFILLYYLIGYLRGNSFNWLLVSGIVIFFITFLMIVSLSGHPDIFSDNMYNIQHIQALIFGILGFIFIWLVDIFIKKKKINRFFLPVILVLSAILFLLLLKIFIPILFEGIIKSFQGVSTGVVPHKMARSLISEMEPLGPRITFDYFSTSFYLALIALIINLIYFFKNKKPEHFFISIWSIIIIIMSGVIPFWGQGRFSYYLSVNVALLSAFLTIKGFSFGWKGLRMSQRISLNPPLKPLLIVGSLLIIFNSFFFLIYPFPLNAGFRYPNNLPDILKNSLLTAKGGPHIKDSDWYKALDWLKENTPEVDVNYYDYYGEPGINKETNEINRYFYSKKDYGVLAKWDVGHMITYYAHRIPVSNPFQQGIGRKEDEKVVELGEAVFFIENDEKKAISYLDKLKTRYVITDYSLTVPDGLFKQEIRWAQSDLEGYVEEDERDRTPSKFDNSMIARLHLLDGRSTTTKREVDGEEIEFYIKPLDHFRLIYESPKTVAFSTETPCDKFKKVKIFEYVKGAKIKGRAINGVEVSISTEIETNQERKFIYQKSIEAKDNYFEFIVPYSNFKEERKIENETQFDVFASSYKLKIGSREIEVNVSEKDILEGRIIKI